MEISDSVAEGMGPKATPAPVTVVLGDPRERALASDATGNLIMDLFFFHIKNSKCKFANSFKLWEIDDNKGAQGEDILNTDDDDDADDDVKYESFSLFFLLDFVFVGDIDGAGDLGLGDKPEDEDDEPEPEPDREFADGFKDAGSFFESLNVRALTENKESGNTILKNAISDKNENSFEEANDL